MGLITGRPLASRARMISISSSAARIFLANFLAFVVIAAFVQTAGRCALVAPCWDRNRAVVVRRYVKDLAVVIDGTRQIHPLAGGGNDISSRCHRRVLRRSSFERACFRLRFSDGMRPESEIRNGPPRCWRETDSNPRFPMRG